MMTSIQQEMTATAESIGATPQAGLTSPQSIRGAEKTIRDLLALADIQVGGNRPWDIQVHNPEFY